MTTEIEQEFFKTFEVEPIEYRKNVPCLNFLSSGICNITDERCNPSKCNEYRPDKTNRLWRDFMEVYPEITDRRLLEMICILSAYNYIFEDLKADDIEQLKEEIIKLFFDYPLIAEEEKAKIQQLFKERE